MWLPLPTCYYVSLQTRSTNLLQCLQWRQSVFQSLGGALVVSAAQSLFQNEILTALSQTNPRLSPGSVFEVEASQVQTSFSAADLPGIDASYMKGIRMTFALAVSMAGVSALVALRQNWFRLRTPEDIQASGAVAKEQQQGNDLEK